MTYTDLVKEYFPEVDDATADAILWARTGFPAFFRGDPEAVMREQLKEAREDMLRVTATGEKWRIDLL
jgi:hypothetical protein